MCLTFAMSDSLPPCPTRARRVLTALEICFVYAGILLYIWRWQAAYPRAWIGLLVMVLASHIAHHDRLSEMGLTLAGLRASARIALPLAMILFVPAVAYALASRKLLILPLSSNAVAAFGFYGAWCVVQQYLMQSYFYRRLMSLSNDRHLTSAIVALMFGAAHLPNPVLTVVTALGGFLLAEIFARHRNIYPLALAQTVGGFLVAALSPASLIHNMRVGPGYFFFDLR
jgi:hypothetical protein